MPLFVQARPCTQPTTPTSSRRSRLVAVVRLDHDVAALVRQVTDLTRQVDDLHNRLVDIAEAAVETLARR